MAKKSIGVKAPDLFAIVAGNVGLGPCVTELRFHPTRKWRFDYAFPDNKIAIEKEGGIWTGGRHSRGAGMVKDMEKYNEAELLGWHVFRFTPSKLKTDGLLMLARIKEAIDAQLLRI